MLERVIPNTVYPFLPAFPCTQFSLTLHPSQIVGIQASSCKHCVFLDAVHARPREYVILATRICKHWVGNRIVLRLESYFGRRQRTKWIRHHLEWMSVVPSSVVPYLQFRRRKNQEYQQSRLKCSQDALPLWRVIQCVSWWNVIFDSLNPNLKNWGKSGTCKFPQWEDIPWSQHRRLLFCGWECSHDSDTRWIVNVFWPRSCQLNEVWRLADNTFPKLIWRELRLLFAISEIDQFGG